MADTKLTDQAAITTPSASDETYIVDDPAGTPVGGRITITNLAKSLAAFERLPHEQRAIVFWVTVEGLQYQEVADILGQPHDVIDCIVIVVVANC